MSDEAIDSCHKIREGIQKQERNYLLVLLKLMNYRVYCLVATKLQELLSHLSLQHLLGIEL